MNYLDPTQYVIMFQSSLQKGGYMDGIDYVHTVPRRSDSPSKLLLTRPCIYHLRDKAGVELILREVPAAEAVRYVRGWNTHLVFFELEGVVILDEKQHLLWTLKYS